MICTMDIVNSVCNYNHMEGFLEDKYKKIHMKEESPGILLYLFCQNSKAFSQGINQVNCSCVVVSMTKM